MPVAEMHDSAMWRGLAEIKTFGRSIGRQGIKAIYKSSSAGQYDLAGRHTVVVIRYLTTRHEDYHAYKTVIYIDVQHQAPVMIENYDWGTGEFLSRYAYTNVKYNVGLKNAAFSPESIGLKSN